MERMEARVTSQDLRARIRAIAWLSAGLLILTLFAVMMTAGLVASERSAAVAGGTAPIVAASP